MDWQLQFVHSADFHLHRPPYGIAEVPDHLRDTLLDAPARAAVRVFDTAITEQADFVLLSGNLLDPDRAGPRGVLALVEQFERLAEHNIAVYWARGEIDPPQRWPAGIRLPENVHAFPCGRPAELAHEREGVPIAFLQGVSSQPGTSLEPEHFHPHPAGLVSIAVACGSAPAEVLKARGLHYWALGGSQLRQTLLNSPCVIHDPGTPQARHPQQLGPHGCTVVRVDAEGKLRSAMVNTDVLRWHAERVVLDAGTTRPELEGRLRHRTQSLAAASPGTDLLILWTIAGSGPLAAQLRRGSLTTDLLGMLRQDFGYGSPAAWSVSIALEPESAVMPEWFEEKTISGDFLRTVREYQTRPDLGIDLERLLPEEHRHGPLAEAAVLDEPTRRQVLAEAALLGMDLLTGEEPQP